MTRATAIYRKAPLPRAGPKPETYAFADRSRDWMDSARCCRGYDPELWHPIGVPPQSTIKICRACPVQLRCIDYAWDNGILHSIWGGMTASQRYQWKRLGIWPVDWVADEPLYRVMRAK